jgi:type II secretory pathway pseudopilin PulG
MRSQGLTLIEVLLAVLILLFVSLAVFGVFTGGFRGNAVSQEAVQASEVLSTLTAQIAQHTIGGGNFTQAIYVYQPGPSPTPLSPNPPPSSCSSFLQQHPGDYCATVTNEGNVTLASGLQQQLYEVQACWKTLATGGMSCEDATTFF